MDILMKCGHIANGRSGDKPCCVICDCFDVDKELYSLNNRFAQCTECGYETQSNFNLPFFKYNANSEYDSYYCGCRGWD